MLKNGPKLLVKTVGLFNSNTCLKLHARLYFIFQCGCLLVKSGLQFPNGKHLRNRLHFRDGGMQQVRCNVLNQNSC